MLSLGLNAANLCVDDVHMSDHCCVLFVLISGPEPVPSELRCQRRIITENTVVSFATLFDFTLFSECHDVDSLMRSFNSH